MVAVEALFRDFVQALDYDKDMRRWKHVGKVLSEPNWRLVILLELRFGEKTNLFYGITRQNKKNMESLYFLSIPYLINRIFLILPQR